MTIYKVDVHSLNGDDFTRYFSDLDVACKYCEFYTHAYLRPVKVISRIDAKGNPILDDK